MDLVYLFVQFLIVSKIQNWLSFAKKTSPMNVIVVCEYIFPNKATNILWVSKIFYNAKESNVINRVKDVFNVYL